MKEADNLEMIWRATAVATLPDPSSMAAAARSYRNNGLLKKVLLVIAAIIASVLEGFVLYIADSNLMRAGAVLGLLACVVLGWTNVRSMSRFIASGIFDNTAFIAFLEQSYRNRLYYYRRTQPLGFGLCAASLFAFSFDAVTKGAWLTEWLYAGVLIFLAVMWLFVRPRTFKRKAAKLQRQIEDLKNLNNYSNEN
ncbi:MAG: hypothetical protein EOO51_12335 [Flavobacterium sp.]|nr:MAG: hypothetical protein EOO51_12335 [Flavobacterium sp.]